MRGQDKTYLIDKEVQMILGTLLRIGVLLSSLIIFLGGILYLTVHSNELVSFTKFKPVPSKFSGIETIFEELLTFDGLAIIQFGVLLLIFTPIARVLFSIFSFLIEKDYMYVAIGTIVLGVIITSLYLKVAH